MWLNVSAFYCIEHNACSFSTAVCFNTAIFDDLNEKFISVLGAPSDTVRVINI